MFSIESFYIQFFTYHLFVLTLLIFFKYDLATTCQMFLFFFFFLFFFLLCYQALTNRNGKRRMVSARFSVLVFPLTCTSLPQRRSSVKNTNFLRCDKRKSVFFISFNCHILKLFSILHLTSFLFFFQTLALLQRGNDSDKDVCTRGIFILQVFFFLFIYLLNA